MHLCGPQLGSSSRNGIHLAQISPIEIFSRSAILEQPEIFELRYSIQLNRDLVEAVGNAYMFGGVRRNPNPQEVERLLRRGADPNFPDLHAQPDFVIPWKSDNKILRYMFIVMRIHLGISNELHGGISFSAKFVWMRFVTNDAF